AVSDHGDTPDKIDDFRVSGQPRLNGKLSARSFSGAPRKIRACRIRRGRPLDVPPLVSYGAGMAIQSGRSPFGADRGHIILRTGRAGIAATAGHDLTID